MKTSDKFTEVVMLLAAFVVAGIAAGCSPKVKSPAIGSWRGQNDNGTVQFRSDGTLRGIDKGGKPLTGSFEFLDADRVRIKMTISSVDRAGVKMVDNAEGICRLEVQGDWLALTEENGPASRYHRTKWQHRVTTAFRQRRVSSSCLSLLRCPARPMQIVTPFYDCL
jgi:hypothetical protein